ncbi:hypothetical protein [Thioclava sp. GXIMD4216]|uniref:hypothetical protein n=1 Tax=Thioclava sp. GXIMD4216 TaxID=3131929 RepID=UPI0030D43EE8
MLIRFWKMLFITVTVAMLATVSIGSASAMAPDRDLLIKAQAEALGLSGDDLCGGSGKPEHRCPFCHLLPDVDLPVLAAIRWSRVFQAQWLVPVQFRTAPHSRDHARIPRAPPVAL